MIINRANLDAVRLGFSTAFTRGLGQAPSDYLRVATVVPATVREQKYGWLGKLPNVREWLGARAVQNLQEHDYAIREKKWELTIGVDRDDIETDNIGVYTPMFEEMGMSTGAHWDLLTWGLLKQGTTTACYDGQPFFDADHPVLDENGEPQSVSNTAGGSGTPWYLLVSKRPLKPLILQKRRDFAFIAKDRPEDDNVFNENEFVYGSDARANVGFGFWQFAVHSAQTLNAANYATARAMITGMKGDHGRPLGLVPDLLVVPPTLEAAGRAVLKSQLVNGGETNPWAGSAELLLSPWLA